MNKYQRMGSVLGCGSSDLLLDGDNAEAARGWYILVSCLTYVNH